MNALICSGLNTKEFIFVGFLSANKKDKIKKLEELKEENKTLIFYEAPHKMKKTLETILEIFGNRKIVLAREITKIHEEFIRGTISEILENQEELRGEFVILIEGSQEEKKNNNLNQLSLDEQYEFYLKNGLEKKEIIKKIAKDRGTNKNEIYQYFLNK